MHFSRRNDVNIELPVSLVLQYSDRAMLQDKNCHVQRDLGQESQPDPGQESQPDLRQELRRDLRQGLQCNQGHELNEGFTKKSNTTKSVLEELDACRRDVNRTRAVLRCGKYHTYEESILRDLRDISEDISERIFANQDTMDNLELPSITLPEQLRPTTLLERVIAKHRLMKMQKLSKESFGNVDFEQLVDGSKMLKLQLWVEAARRGSFQTKSSSSCETPTLRYEHNDGNCRNLPGQPELIRLLSETKSENKTGNNSSLSDSNKLLELYGDIEPPLIDGIKRKARRRRKVVCKFCGKAPGCHQKWCIYYQTEPEQEVPKIKMVRSHTDPNIKTERMKASNIKTERSKTTVQKRQFTRPDIPDYSLIHRDVYIQALAISRARAVLRRGYEFTQQTTKPFVFSYFKGYGQSYEKKLTSDKFNEMEHIFGKRHVDFTRYYDRFVKDKKVNNKTTT